MNIPDLSLFIHVKSFEASILMAFFVLSLILAGYNWFYLYHSLHVSSKHMGLSPSSHIGYIIKTSIFLSVFAAFLSGLFLILGTL